MSRVQIHCYGCDATVPVATATSAEDLSRAGWSLARGETYCPACAPAVLPSPEAPTGAGDAVTPTGETSPGCDAAAISPGGQAAATPPDGVAAPISPDREAAAIAASADIARRWRAGGSAASMLATIRRPRLGRGHEKHGPERHGPRLRPVAALVATRLQATFSRPRRPVTSHSKVSSQTIALFCLAAALTLGTLGSNDFALRLPGVILAFAAGMSWLRDLRSAS
jgi:hypothetical protein